MQGIETIKDIFHGEAAGTGAGDGVSDDLVETAFAFGFVGLDFPGTDEGSGALLGFEYAADFQFPIGAENGVGVDGEIDGELADSGELVAGSREF